jgi:hypothetical protein
VECEREKKSKFQNKKFSTELTKSSHRKGDLLVGLCTLNNIGQRLADKFYFIGSGFPAQGEANE